MDKNNLKRVAVVVLSLSAGGLAGIAANEGFSSKAYKDGGGTWTIAHGHTKGVKPGDTATRQQGLVYLKDDASTAEKAIHKLVKVDLHQHEYDAMVDFVFNVGEGNFAKSTVLKMLNQKKYMESCDHLFDWVYIGKTFSKGLLNRRLKEYKECTGINKHYVAWSGQ